MTATSLAPGKAPDDSDAGESAGTWRRTAPQRTAGGDDTWGFEPGDEIGPGLTAARLLGGGRRYEAYLAHDETLLAPVVVKIVRPSRASDAAVLEGLEQELRALTELTHPSICRGYRGVAGGDRPHVVLEHIEGPRLSTLVRRFGRVDLEQLLPLAVQISSALHYLHGCGLVHLDVKPQNIVMGAPPRLIDLSLVTPFTEAARLDVPVGTDAYMAPEQCNPDPAVPVGPAADVWGLGVSLYEACAGELPFPRDPAELHPQRRLAPAPLPRGVPGVLAEVIGACLQRAPQDRPAPAEMWTALQPLTELPRRLVLGGLRPRWR